MTKLEKVIKGLKCRLECGCVNDDLCNPECPYLEDQMGCYGLDIDVLELLKEQEPIKPTVVVDTWICSNCGHTLESQTLIDDKENPQILVNEQYDFCPQCGKAVKWE